MKKSFSILHEDKNITIEQLAGDQHGNVYYVAHVAGEAIELEYTEDDEGAGHWLDKKTNHPTETSTTIGQLIELYKVQQHSND